MSGFLKGNGRESPMRLFEENYASFMRFLPDLDRRDGFALADDTGAGEMAIRIVERTRYTTSLNLRQRMSLAGERVPDLDMTVRLYHDAKAAEVIAYQGCQRIPPPYAAFPPYRRDERRQVNRLLHQILRYCERRNLQRVDCTNP